MKDHILQATLYKPLYAFNLDIQLELTARADSLAILGPSGSGKSMALRMIAGLVEPSEGLVSLKGQSLYDSWKGINLPPRKRRIGYVFQNYALFPHMSVSQNIMFGMLHTTSSEREKTCRQLLKEIRLEDYATRYPSQLSGGQQQRVALARALAAEPELLLLDEPFSALDAELRGDLEALLLRVRESRQVPYILVTHNLEEAYRLCDNLAVIENGKILQTGPKKEILKRPRNLETAKRLGAKNLWSAKLWRREGQGGEVFVPLLNNTLHINKLPDGNEFWVGIRPSEVVLFNGPETNRLNTFSIIINCLVQGIRSHTLYVYPLQMDNPTLESEIILEVPVHRHDFNSPTICLPQDKLFAIPKG